jgi:hypothetical protein
VDNPANIYGSHLEFVKEGIRNKINAFCEVRKVFDNGISLLDALFRQFCFGSLRWLEFAFSLLEIEHPIDHQGLELMDTLRTSKNRKFDVLPAELLQIQNRGTRSDIISDNQFSLCPLASRKFPDSTLIRTVVPTLS